MSIRIGLEKVQEAVDVRAAISERYRTYGVLSKIVQSTALVDHADFKHAVDALYYLGGGWPTENSKGRMERMLDNFAGMYKVLTLIGRGHIVEGHLLKKGIRVQLDDQIRDIPFSDADIRLLNEEFGMAQFNFKTPTKLSELVSACVDEAQELQRYICRHADIIKQQLKPAAKAELEVEDEEYDRLFFLTKFQDKPDRVVKKKNTINSSVDKFKTVATSRL